MLSNIEFKFGRSSGAPHTTLEAMPLTVFVGPNNSGKSLVLRELHNYLHDGQSKENHQILSSIDFEPLPEDQVDDEIARLRLRPHWNESIVEGHVLIGTFGSRMQVPLEELSRSLRNPDASRSQFCSWYFRNKILFLDGAGRIHLINQKEAGDLQSAPENSFQALFGDDEKREAVRAILADAFGEFFVIDPTNLGLLRLRMSSVPPESPNLERGIDQAAVTFHASAIPIDEKSDGVKAFAGIVCEIMAGDPNVILIDEPEAFLHPTLSFKLGKQIALQTQGNNKKVFASTHSASFLRGCIQSGAPVNIVRLTYTNQVATARVPGRIRSSVV